MIDERHVFALRFRELAKRLAHPGINETALLEEAGRLVMAAHGRGFLALPGLGAWVDWVENPPLRPEEAQATLYPCPSNLFREVCGFNRWPARISKEAVELTGDAIGGIVPGVLGYSLALRRPLLAQSINKQNATLRMQFGLVCNMLADEIEHTSGEDARDCWIYEQATISRTWQWIAENIPDWCRDREQVTTPNGVKKAATRYAEKHSLPPIQKRKSGRPRNTN
jgi:hypothetical protein